MPSLYVNEPMISASGQRRGAGRNIGMIEMPAPGGAAATDLAPRKGDCVELLTRMVEGEIIPRLLMAHQNAPPSHPPIASPSFGPETADEFAQMVLSKDVDSLIAYVGGLLARGVTVPAVYMDLLAPTARKLGDYWDADYCSFADVTIALGKLQHILHNLSRRDAMSLERQRQGRSVLLATSASEQHTFGMLVIEEFFRRAGWRTWAEPGAEPGEIARMVNGQWYDLFGLSVSCESQLDQTAEIITSVKNSSRNRSIRVMVGGRLFMANPELAASVGADVTASDGNEAVAAAESAVSKLEGRG